MSESVEPGSPSELRPAGRLGAGERALLAGRIVLDALLVWRGLRHRRIARLVERLDQPGRVARTVEPRRLGRLVHRVMNLGPLHPRCLTMSLVFFRELRRQGTPAELVIGLPAAPTDPTAHAWVEVEGEVVGPPPGRLGHAEMARYGGGGTAGRGGGPSSDSTRSRDPSART